MIKGQIEINTFDLQIGYETVVDNTINLCQIASQTQNRWIDKRNNGQKLIPLVWHGLFNRRRQRNQFKLDNRLNRKQMDRLKE